MGATPISSSTVDVRDPGEQFLYLQYRIAYQETRTNKHTHTHRSEEMVQDSFSVCLFKCRSCVCGRHCWRYSGSAGFSHSHSYSGCGVCGTVLSSQEQ